MHVERHIADLVEEQRAAVGLFKAPLTDLVRSGEGAFLVAEQLRLDQILGMAAMFRAMNGDLARGLWRCSACATSPLPVPDSPLISTLIDERDSRPDDAKHVLHRRRFADDVRRRSLAGWLRTGCCCS